ncbi:MAG: hypothetical protein OEM19_04305, partial [Deltaproteobacteria bacterium]|nr:hypothetical protein [Deltaproteobacteria bacterium]
TPPPLKTVQSPVSGGIQFNVQSFESKPVQDSKFIVRSLETGGRRSSRHKRVTRVRTLNKNTSPKKQANP